MPCEVECSSSVAVAIDRGFAGHWGPAQATLRNTLNNCKLTRQISTPATNYVFVFSISRQRSLSVCNVAFGNPYRFECENARLPAHKCLSVIYTCTSLRPCSYRSWKTSRWYYWISEQRWEGYHYASPTHREAFPQGQVWHAFKPGVWVCLIILKCWLPMLYHHRCSDHRLWPNSLR